jgi:hypothetical protein
MLTERELQISPVVQESVLHNTKVRPVPAATSHSLSARSLFPLTYGFLYFAHCLDPSNFGPHLLQSSFGLSH